MTYLFNLEERVNKPRHLHHTANNGRREQSDPLSYLEDHNAIYYKQIRHDSSYEREQKGKTNVFLQL